MHRLPGKAKRTVVFAPQAFAAFVKGSYWLFYANSCTFSNMLRQRFLCSHNLIDLLLDEPFEPFAFSEAFLTNHSNHLHSVGLSCVTETVRHFSSLIYHVKYQGHTAFI